MAKKEIKLHAVYDEETDKFATSLSYIGFDKSKPLMNSLIVIGVLEKAKQAELDEIKG